MPRINTVEHGILMLIYQCIIVHIIYIHNIYRYIYFIYIHIHMYILTYVYIYIHTHVLIVVVGCGPSISNFPTACLSLAPVWIFKVFSLNFQTNPYNKVS